MGNEYHSDRIVLYPFLKTNRAQQTQLSTYLW